MNLGQIKGLEFDLEAPLKIHTELINTGQLMIMVGANGTGKSFVLKTTWVMGMVSAGYVLGVGQKPKSILSKEKTAEILTQGSLEEYTQFLFDNSFEDHKTQGSIRAVYENGEFTVKFTDGKLDSIEAEVKPGVTEITRPVFMSTNTRLYSQMDRYLEDKKVFGPDDLLKRYKLYDLAFIEGLEARLQTPHTLSETLKAGLETASFNVKIKTIFIKDNAFWFTDGEDKERKLSTLSNGEQAYINMLVAQELN